MMDRTVIILTIVILSVVPWTSTNDLDSLGARINAQVQQAVRPLDNLGQRINQRVQEELYPLRSSNYYRPAPGYAVYNYGNRRPVDSYGNWPPYNTYNTGFNSYNGNGFNRWNTNNDDDDDHDDDADDFVDYDDQLDMGLGLDHLGDDIEKQVEDSLRPVRAMEEVLKMKSGIGGSTVVTFSPRGQQLIIRNNIMYECIGIINKGQCSGDLQQFTPQLDEDFCYIRSYSQINDQLCISTGPISFSNLNRRFQCKSVNKDTPYLLISASGYNRLCQDVATNSTYTYYARSNDPMRVQIPNSNPFVKCTNNQPGVCVFSETNQFPSSSGNIRVSSGNNAIHNFHF